MEITIKSIPHASQKYPTIGDWTVGADGNWHIYVSELGDWRMELLVAFHEMIEMALCQQRGITEDEVTKFDVAFEEAREKGVVDGEPGDSDLAPYQAEHQFATELEHRFAEELQVDWDEYEKRIDNA